MVIICFVFCSVIAIPHWVWSNNNGSFVIYEHKNTKFHLNLSDGLLRNIDLDEDEIIYFDGNVDITIDGILTLRISNYVQNTDNPIFKPQDYYHYRKGDSCATSRDETKVEIDLTNWIYVNDFEIINIETLDLSSLSPVSPSQRYEEIELYGLDSRFITGQIDYFHVQPIRVYTTKDGNQFIIYVYKNKIYLHIVE